MSALSKDHNTFPSKIPYMAAFSLFVILVTNCCAKNRKISVLFSSTHRKFFQFLGILWKGVLLNIQGDDLSLDPFTSLI